MPAVTVEQFDLIKDDPRREAEKGIMAEMREFYQASRELRGLLTQAQAAKILGVQTGQISSWVSRGRLTSRVVAETRMVSGGEVLALYKERQTAAKHQGGRGLKAPSLWELSEAAWSDMFPEE